jgi:hypothetical protein
MTRRRVEPSVFVIDRRGEDAQRRYCARLLLAGWDLQSAATLAGLPIATVREIASTVGADDFTSEAPPP